MATEELNANLTAGTVTAKRFQLVGDNGELRALLETQDGNPILEFMDDSSRVRLNVAVTNNWPIINMKDENGNVRVELGTINGSPTLFLNDHIGNLKIGIALSKSESSPRIVFLDDERNIRFGVISDTTGTPRVIATDQLGGKHRLMWFSDVVTSDEDIGKP